MLYLVRGLPGSGKSTFCFHHFKGVLHLENDMFHMIPCRNDNKCCEYDFQNDFRVERALDCFKFTMKFLKMDYPVVVSNVFATKESIDRYVNAAKEIGHKTIVFRMTSQFQNQHNVPEDVLKWMKENSVDYSGEFLVSIPDVKCKEGIYLIK